MGQSEMREKADSLVHVGVIFAEPEHRESLEALECSIVNNFAFYVSACYLMILKISSTKK
jgi:hypothetical protein